jgi:hypothetical protein
MILVVKFSDTIPWWCIWPLTALLGHYINVNQYTKIQRLSPF